MDPRNYSNLRSPPRIDTSTVPQPRGENGNHGRRNNRFSFAETPVAMQEPFFGSQTDTVTAEHGTLEEQYTPIEEGTWNSTDGYQIQNRDRISHDAYNMSQSAHLGQGRNADPVRRTTSPYGVPEPQGVHPAYFAPVVEQQPRNQSPAQPPAPALTQPMSTYAQPASTYTQSDPTYHPHQTYPDSAYQSSPTQQSTPRPNRASTMPLNRESAEVKKSSPEVQPDHIQVPYSPNQPIFAPSALTGPNGLDPEMHQPGQIAHPNMQMSEYTGDSRPWMNSLCSCGTDIGTCMTGLFCPCILDSKTAYRMQKRGERKDPTDLLGYETCNARCGIFAVFGVCGLCCIFPLTLRTRIRHAYKLEGNFCSDILESCCCCCCVAIQNEREVRDREERLRQNAGPATQYASTPRMTYAPGGPQ